jgi:hypothetical protein
MVDFSGVIQGLLWLICLLIVFGVIMILSVGILFFQPDYKQEAIDRGFAVYCQDDGSWAWVGECNSDDY